MKYIKLKCDSYNCETEFLIAINEWYNREYEEKIHEYYVCPICESMVFVDNKENCIVDINNLEER